MGKVISVLWTGRGRRGKVGVVVGGVIVFLWLFIGVSNAIWPQDDVTPSAAESSSSSGGDASCSSLRIEVEEYNTLDPGNSREGYLVGLHQLQRDCASEAGAAGLTGEGFPPCGNDLTAENCTAYEGP